MSAKTTTATEVEIFGSVYHVRGEKNPEYLHSLAEMVDRKMREIGQHVSTVDTSKIAILAALNLADELVQCRTEQEGEAWNKSSFDAHWMNIYGINIDSSDQSTGRQQTRKMPCLPFYIRVLKRQAGSSSFFFLLFF